MKQVFANGMVAHVWAQRNQPSGRSHNRNFSFKGDSLYSYSTVIGRFVDSHLGLVVLATSRRYSNTTSVKHMPALRRAVRGETRVFYVNDPAPGCYHKDNLKGLHDAYLALRGKAMRIRDDARGWMSRQLREAFNDVRDYSLAFKVPVPTIELENDLKAIADRFARLTEAENDPARAAKREKERARREARKSEKQRETKAEARVKFRAGEWHPALRSLPVMLRVDGEEIVTSHGARFPVEHGKRAFKAIAAIKASGQGWETNGKTIPLGHFKVDRVSPDGEVRAGCHVVAWPEIEHCAASLGLVE